MTRQEILNAYMGLPTGNISDAMDRLKLPRGVMIDGPTPISYTQPHMVGFACTVQQMPRHQAEGDPKAAKHLTVFDEIAQPGDVVVIDVGNRKDVCTGGSMGALRMKKRGIQGLIVNGCYRDIAEVLKLDFPLFCTGVTPIRSSPMLQTVGINVPIVVGGVQVRAGDLVVGDDSGIIVIPIEFVESVLILAKEIQAVETLMVQFLEEGTLSYPECRKKAEAIVRAEVERKIESV